MAKKKKLELKINPLLSIAQGISYSKDEQVFEEQPVDFVEFVESRKFLNQKWNGRTGCRPKIMDIGVELVKPHVREAILLLGKGAGKDFIASIIHLYGIYKCLCLLNPQAYFGLAPAPIYFVNTARNEGQAKNVFFKQFMLLLQNCPWFEGKYREPGAITIEFQKGIQALSANSQAFGWLGFNTIQWVGDELAFFLEKDNDDEGSSSRSRECWEAAFGSCKTRFPTDYKMIGITTPRHDDDFVMKKFWELKDRKDGYVIKAATWDIHPNLTKEDFKHALIVDYRRTMRDFGAEPVGVIESFWAEPKVLEDMVCEECRNCEVYKNRELNDDIYACWIYDDCKANAYMGNGEWRDWFVPPLEDNDYTIHFDLAKNKDKVGFCLGRMVGEVKIELDLFKLREEHKDEELELIDEDDKFETKALIKIDAVGWISISNPEFHRGLLKNGEFYFTGIRENIIFKLQKKGFNISHVTFDQYQSLDFKQQLEDRDIDVELISLDRTDEIPSSSKYAVMEQRVYYPYSKLLCDEAKYLKYINGKKVDHAQKSCFVGSTKVKLLNGQICTMKELTEKYKDKEFWVYSFDNQNLKVVPGLARNPRITKVVDKYIRIKLDNGKYVRTTLDHLFLTINGKYVEAKDLKIGQSLMPLYTKSYNCKGFNSKRSYEKVYDVFRRYWIPTHRIVANYKYKHWPDRKEVVHHINFDSTNNDPENLLILDRNEHIKYHQDLIKKLWREKFMEMRYFSTEEYRGKENIEKRNFKISIALKNSDFDFKKHIEKTIKDGLLNNNFKFGKYHYAFRNDISIEQIENLANKGHTKSEICKILKCSKKCFHSRIKDYGYKSYLGLLKKLNVRRDFVTHNERLDVNIEKIKNLLLKGLPIYKIAIELKCGRNTIFRKLNRCGYKSKFDLVNKKISKVNHKIVEIKIFNKTKKMYDITVDKWHNFALEAGVFVHQSKDVWDSFAGTIYNVEKYLMSTGAWAMDTYTDDD